MPAETATAREITESTILSSLFYLGSAHDRDLRNLGIDLNLFLQPHPISLGRNLSLQARKRHTSTSLMFIVAPTDVRESNPILVWRIRFALSHRLAFRISCEAVTTSQK